MRSEGVEPIRLHASADKVHLLGGWTRFNANDEPILENRVTYILTRIDGSWGIQARFGTDSWIGHEVESTTKNALNLVERFIEHLGKNDLSASAECCRLPLTVVGIGKVTTATSADDVVSLLGNYRDRGVQLISANAVQTGTRGAIVEVNTKLNDGSEETKLVVIGERDDRWSIAGVSRFTPP